MTIFASVLTTLFIIIPLAALLVNESQKNKRLARLQYLKDIETLALNGWIIISNRFSS